MDWAWPPNFAPYTQESVFDIFERRLRNKGPVRQKTLGDGNRAMEDSRAGRRKTRNGAKAKASGKREYRQLQSKEFVLV